jgi:Cu-processing system permease protein
MSAVGALYRFELRTARRGRVALLFTVGFALAAVGIALAGLSAGGVLAVQGFARTSVSLLQLVIWAVPAIALLVGAAAGADLRDTEFIVALPIARPLLVLSRWLAWFTVLAGALAVGLGAAGVVIALLAGAADAGAYLALMGVAFLVLAACLALGLSLGIVVRTRARALALALLAWFVLTVGVDLIAITALSLLPPRGLGWGLSLLLLADPVDSARALGLGLFQADIVAGPTGAALRQVLGRAGSAVLAGGLLAWTAVPLLLAGRRFRTGDL